MDAGRLVELLALPSVVFTLAAALFLVLMRSPWPWTRSGGVVLAAAVLGALALALRDESFRAAALDSEGLPILTLALASAVAAWAALRRAWRDARKGGDEPPEAPWTGLGSADLLPAGVVVLGVALGAFFLRAPLAPMADPASPADDSAAPWFLLALQELLRYFDPWVAFVLYPVLTVVGLLALPYLDVPGKGSAGFEQRRDVLFFFLFVWFLLVLVPMMTAAFLERGPAPSPATARPFSELVWAGGPPRLALARELPALVGLALYLLVLPRLLPRWRPTRALFGRYVKRMGRRRFYLAMAFMQVWMLVPLKMYGLWLFGIGYFVYLPEIGVNL